MSDQWVDRQGFLRNSSGRYRTGGTSAAVTESKADELKFATAKGFRFEPSPQSAWASSSRPKLAALLINESVKYEDTPGYIVGIEIDHARELARQLNEAIRKYDQLQRDMTGKKEETDAMLLANAGITVTKKAVDQNEPA